MLLRSALILLSLSFLSGCLSRSELLRRQAEEEDKNPLIAEVQRADEAGRPLEASVVLERLKTACEKSNHRPACLGFMMNHLQRTGARQNVGAAVRYTLGAISGSESHLFNFAQALMRCTEGDASDIDTWKECYEARALFTVNFHWAMASGHDFSKLFPPGSPPSGLPHEVFEKTFPAGRGFTCFQAYGDTYRMGVCFRNPALCEQARVTEFAKQQTTGCEAWKGAVYSLNAKEGFMQDKQACEATEKMSGGVCLMMGDVQR